MSIDATPYETWFGTPYMIFKGKSDRNEKGKSFGPSLI